MPEERPGINCKSFWWEDEENELYLGEEYENENMLMKPKTQTKLWLLADPSCKIKSFMLLKCFNTCYKIKVVKFF